MSALEITLGIILILCAVVLIIVVLLQDSKDHNISGVIAGGAENMFGKSKGQTISKKLNVITGIVSVVLVLVVLAFYLQQYVPSKKTPVTGTDTSAVTDTVGTDTKAPETTPATDTSAVTDTVSTDTVAPETTPATDTAAPSTDTAPAAD